MNNFTQYLGLYLETAKKYIQALNNSLLVLEKNFTDKDSIDEIFRSAHSLKSQSAAMQFSSTGILCHTIEDVFYEIKNGRLELNRNLANILFSAFDSLEKSIQNIESESKEIDLQSQIDLLKKQTGVETQGLGKSIRTEDSQSDSNPTPSLDTAPDSTPITTSALVSTSTEETPQEFGGHIEVGDKTETNNQIDEKKNEDTEHSEEIIEESTKDKINSFKKVKTISVDVEKLDGILNLLEELLVHQFELKKIAHDSENETLFSYYEATQKILDSLQYEIMQARTVPLKLIFDHYPRAVRDVASTENKNVELKIIGEDLSLDRKIVEKLDEPLTHLLRNAVSHGIENEGVVNITAKRESDYMIIEVADNGKGINWQKISEMKKGNLEDPQEMEKLLFSGISTSDKVSQISGRGVGLLAVKKMVQDFGGFVNVRNNEPKGTIFSLKLPLSLSIVKSLLLSVGKNKYAIPAISVNRSFIVKRADIQKTAHQEAILFEDSDVPLIRLSESFQISNGNGEQKAGEGEDDVINDNTLDEDLMVVVVNLQHGNIALVVDRVLDTVDLVVKPIPEVLPKTFFGGAAVLANGEVALVINGEKLK